jgi:signal transduction protein with GAF and PtsI domain
VIADRATALLGAGDCGVYLTDRERKVLTPIYSNDAENREAIMAFEMPIGEGLSGRVAGTGVGAYINIGDKDDYAVHILGTDEAEDEDESVMAIPMLDGSDVLGIITVNKTGDVFADDDLEKLAVFARQAGMAVKRTRNVEALRRSEERNIPRCNNSH